MMGVSVPPKKLSIALVSFLGCRLMYTPCSMDELARIPIMFNGLMTHLFSHASRLRGVFLSYTHNLFFLIDALLVVLHCIMSSPAHPTHFFSLLITRKRVTYAN